MFIRFSRTEVRHRRRESRLSRFDLVHRLDTAAEPTDQGHHRETHHDRANSQ